MFDDDEGPKEWELKDEEPPARLRKKWEKEDVSGSGAVVCPSCKKETPAENLTCVFCQATLPQGRGVLSGLLSWVKGFFGM